MRAVEKQQWVNMTADQAAHEAARLSLENIVAAMSYMRLPKLSDHWVESNYYIFACKQGGQVQYQLVDPNHQVVLSGDSLEGFFRELNTSFYNITSNDEREKFTFPTTEVFFQFKDQVDGKPARAINTHLILNALDVIGGAILGMISWPLYIPKALSLTISNMFKYVFTKDTAPKRAPRVWAIILAPVLAPLVLAFCVVASILYTFLTVGLGFITKPLMNGIPFKLTEFAQLTREARYRNFVERETSGNDFPIDAYSPQSWVLFFLNRGLGIALNLVMALTIYPALATVDWVRKGMDRMVKGGVLNALLGLVQLLVTPVAFLASTVMGIYRGIRYGAVAGLRGLGMFWYLPPTKWMGNGGLHNQYESNPDQVTFTWQHVLVTALIAIATVTVLAALAFSGVGAAVPVISLILGGIKAGLSAVLFNLLPITMTSVGQAVGLSAVLATVGAFVMANVVAGALMLGKAVSYLLEKASASSAETFDTLHTTDAELNQDISAHQLYEALAKLGNCCGVEDEEKGASHGSLLGDQSVGAGNGKRGSDDPYASRGFIDASGDGYANPAEQPS